MPTVLRILAATLLLSGSLAAGAQTAFAPTIPHTTDRGAGKTGSLNLPPGFALDVIATGLHRVRFFAQAPDGRVFVTGMFNKADNTRGSVFILDGFKPDGFDPAHPQGPVHVTRYLDGLRNPNNLAFWTDPATHRSWLYLPLTDRLLRYPYRAGDTKPSGPPETLLRFPDYGLNYKYGGWHLTRTVAIATLHGRTRLYIAAGSSCNYCQERETIRASLTAIDPDGSHPQILAHGLRNAVDLRFVPEVDGGALFASNMGDDHLGDALPEDTFFELDSNDRPGPIAAVEPGKPSAVNYGWPACYFAHGKAVLDTTPLPAMPAPGDLATESERPAGTGLPSHGIAPAGTNLPAGGNAAVPDPNANLGPVPPPLTDCSAVPAAYTTFAAHSSPLGLAYFGTANPRLGGSFLVALHGAGHPRIGTGYRLVRFTAADRTPRDFMTGWLTEAGGRSVVHGRPCGLLRVGPDSFLLTDDDLGVIYLVHPD